MKSENFFFLHQLEVCFLGADRFDRLVLTGVSVAKFLNFANFFLIFLHNTHILSVCWSVSRSFLCVLSVCMSVLCTVQYVQLYSMCEYSSVLGPRKSYKFQKIILYRKNRLIMHIFLLNVLKYTEF
jgi:hypothetical protein